MDALFVNVPFVKLDEQGIVHTGPNAGSRWPFTNAGFTIYGCFPFFMGYAVSYLRHAGIDAEMYDAVARKQWDIGLVRMAIASARPRVVFFETSTPLVRDILATAAWAKAELGCRVVLVGPHVQAYADDLLALPFVDHAVVGEYERPALEIMEKGAKADRLYRYVHLENIDTLPGAGNNDGPNFLPHRPFEHLWDYYDPSMDTPRAQLTVSTSRGCPFKCTYCQWPKVMNDGTYRFRRPELVIDEIRTVVRDYAAYTALLAESLAAEDRLALGGLAAERFNETGALAARGDLPQAAEVYAEGQRIERALAVVRAGGIRSIFFDDDTWNLGRRRVETLCRGLADIGLPWTMMGRIDTTGRDVFDLMVDSGCVGMRFGIESFNQRLLDNTKKNLDARTSFETVKYLVTRHRNLELHFTTMRNLPGETAADWQRDQAILAELQAAGAKNGNRVHWQNSSCIPFPGTELWEEMIALGRDAELRDFDLYDGGPSATEKLAKVVGWLGSDYQPKWSKYSKLGAPTQLPDAPGRRA